MKGALAWRNSAKKVKLDLRKVVLVRTRGVSRKSFCARSKTSRNGLLHIEAGSRVDLRQGFPPPASCLTRRPARVAAASEPASFTLLRTIQRCYTAMSPRAAPTAGFTRLVRPRLSFLPSALHAPLISSKPQGFSFLLCLPTSNVPGHAAMSAKPIREYDAKPLLAHQPPAPRQSVASDGFQFSSVQRLNEKLNETSLSMNGLREKRNFDARRLRAHERRYCRKESEKENEREQERRNDAKTRTEL
ncbi:hypothetical protein BJY59DRAFT_141054 [Rhodotorula toruloides]